MSALMQSHDHTHHDGQPRFHPADDLLLSYASGTLEQGAALVVATHLALCPLCREEVARLEALGGALLADVEPVPVGGDMLAGILDRLDAPCHDPVPLRRQARRDGPVPVLPEPLRFYLGGDLDGVKWRRTIPGLQEASVPHVGGSVQMMRIRAGRAMPQHTHRGDEFTLVLQGGFSDACGHFLRGDFAATDPSIDHRPVADTDGDCICLAFTGAPLRLTGRFLRWLNPLMRT